MRTFTPKQNRSRAASGEPARSRATASAPPVVNEVLRSPGQPLDAATRGFMESRFGHDFSQVRVHTDARAAQSAAEVGARAWTFGHDIAFGSGLYAPSAPRGAGLLAHELTHVVQQRGQSGPAASPVLGETEDAHEREAEAVPAVLAASGTPPPVAPVSSPRVQRSLLSAFLDVVLFVPRLFGLSVFPVEDLKEYLAGLKKRKGPEDSLFSDNKARACVARESELGPYNTQTKIGLVQEMLGGHTSRFDEGAIISLLRRSQDRDRIVAAVGRQRLWSKFTGENRRIIEAMTMTAADANDALVERLRKLDPDEIRGFAAIAADPAVREVARRAEALAAITTPVPTDSAITPAGEATFVVNGVQVIVQPDRIVPSLGNRAFTKGRFGGTIPQKVAVTPENANRPVGPFAPVQLTLTMWSEFASEEAKSNKAIYGVGTRPQDKSTLRYHERAHGEAWLDFLRTTPPPAFHGTAEMHPAAFNDAVQKLEADINTYQQGATRFALAAGDCVGKPPTTKQLSGTGFDASICRQ